MDTITIPWLKHVNVDALNEDYHLIISAIGLENCIKLAFTLPSVHFYLKRPELVFREAIEKHITENFNGSNHRMLALECRVSERFVYDVITADREKKRPGWKQETLI